MEDIKGIVKEEIEYFGITINDKKNVFNTQKGIMQGKAQMISNMSYNIICKSCNKLLISKTYWKCLALRTLWNESDPSGRKGGKKSYRRSKMVSTEGYWQRQDMRQIAP